MRLDKAGLVLILKRFLWKYVARYVPMTKYTVVYTEEAEGGFSGRCLELPGAISQGETLEELKVNITDAIQLILASIYEEAHEKKKKLDSFIWNLHVI